MMKQRKAILLGLSASEVRIVVCTGIIFYAIISLMGGW